MHQKHSTNRIACMIKNYAQVSSGLEKEIINKIYKIEKRRLFIKQSLYEGLSLVSFIGIIPATAYIYNTLSTSGLFSYISLVFTNIEALAYWKELLLSILESLPFLGLALCLGALGIFLWSILKTLKIQVMKNAIA